MLLGRPKAGPGEGRQTSRAWGLFHSNDYTEQKLYESTHNETFCILFVRIRQHLPHRGIPGVDAAPAPDREVRLRFRRTLHPGFQVPAPDYWPG